MVLFCASCSHAQEFTEPLSGDACEACHVIPVWFSDREMLARVYLDPRPVSPFPFVLSIDDKVFLASIHIRSAA